MPKPPSSKSLTLAEQWKHRADDAGQLARAVLNESLSEIAPVTSPEELAWLIACKREGALVGWLGLWDNEDYGWTLDPNKAIRFSRQKDADMMRSKWEAEDGDALSSEEHIWC